MSSRTLLWGGKTGHAAIIGTIKKPLPGEYQVKSNQLQNEREEIR